MNSGPTLSIGSTGPDVRRLQVLFVMTKDLEYTDIDGNFGSKTQERVKSFQQGSNLTPDGVVGPLTWKALPADPNTPRLASGASGSAVTGLQKGLREFGGPNTATDPGPIAASGPALSSPAQHSGRRYQHVVGNSNSYVFAHGGTHRFNRSADARECSLRETGRDCLRDAQPSEGAQRAQLAHLEGVAQQVLNPACLPCAAASGNLRRATGRVFAAAILDPAGFSTTSPLMPCAC